MTNTTTPCTGQPSEGHTSAVNVLRMVNTRHQHQAAEPVPFRTRPAPLRSIKPAPRAWIVRPRDEPSPLERGSCATSAGLCMGSATCADSHCQGHPANQVQPEERDGPLLLKVLAVYALVLLAACWGTWVWLGN